MDHQSDLPRPYTRWNRSAIDFLRSREALLILDSFEHLLAPPQSIASAAAPTQSPPTSGGMALLQDILRWAPQVRILVTSRARLGVRGEWAVKLDGLDVPPPPSLPPPHRGRDGERVSVENYSAVQLFVQSARRVEPAFRLTPENLPHVVRICRLMAGLPLGIELAQTVQERLWEARGGLIWGEALWCQGDYVAAQPRLG